MCLQAIPSTSPPLYSLPFVTVLFVSSNVTDTYRRQRVGSFSPRPSAFSEGGLSSCAMIYAQTSAFYKQSGYPRTTKESVLIDADILRVVVHKVLAPKRAGAANEDRTFLSGKGGCVVSQHRVDVIHTYISTHSPAQTLRSPRKTIHELPTPSPIMRDLDTDHARCISPPPPLVLVHDVSSSLVGLFAPRHI